MAFDIKFPSNQTLNRFEESMKVDFPNVKVYKSPLILMMDVGKHCRSPLNRILIFTDLTDAK